MERSNQLLIIGVNLEWKSTSRKKEDRQKAEEKILEYLASKFEKFAREYYERHSFNNILERPGIRAPASFKEKYDIIGN